MTITNIILIFAVLYMWVSGLMYSMIWTPSEFEDEEGNLQDRTTSQFIKYCIFWFINVNIMYLKLFITKEDQDVEE